MAVKVKGAQELREQFTVMSGSLSGKELQRIVFPAAEVIRAEASRRAPRRTGALADHIITEIKEIGSHSVTFGIGPDADRFYGLFVEFGTAASPAKPGKIKKGLLKGQRRAHTATPAQPFLFPAFEDKRGEAERLIRENLLSAVPRGG